jgi:hypothetical protein
MLIATRIEIDALRRAVLQHIAGDTLIRVDMPVLVDLFSYCEVH